MFVPQDGDKDTNACVSIPSRTVRENIAQEIANHLAAIARISALAEKLPESILDMQTADMRNLQLW